MANTVNVPGNFQNLQLEHGRMRGMTTVNDGLTTV